MKRIVFPAMWLIALSVIFVSCNEDDHNEVPAPEGMLTLDIDNLMKLESNERYEGWIIVNGAPVSTGTFMVDDMGKLSQSTFKVDKMELSAATDFVLSIEPHPDNDPAPSAIKILGGGFSGASADITAAHGAALGDDFSSVAGKYILATPTTPETTDELSGVWFLDLASGSPATGLTLPTLPSGWVYEGWAVIDGQPVTTGTFTAADMKDNSAPFSGMGGPTFPGEDFVKNAPAGLTFPTDLTGSTIVISIEPSPDNSPAPFVFKPLVGNVPTPAMDHKTYMMNDNVMGSFPKGSVMR
ncbi:hypothetical protein [Labilibacter marinus]|uniref:hypothetical protein n=1 Tax=Labilibacter marinus TaxID=1477105 RepID=UPI00082C5285|nr:hypothetical protein [Labilibacter marinus]